jgi:hypothetical protein
LGIRTLDTGQGIQRPQEQEREEHWEPGKDVKTKPRGDCWAEEGIVPTGSASIWAGKRRVGLIVGHGCSRNQGERWAVWFGTFFSLVE